MNVRVMTNALALVNLSLGLCAIFMAYHGQYVYSSESIILAVILDTLDGKLVAKLQSGADFARELDSLTDLIAFGVAPAVLMYCAILYKFDFLGAMVTALFPIFGALGLARCNTDNAGKARTFMALPIAAAGGLLSALVLYRNEIHDSTFPYAFPMLMMVLACLMVNNMRPSAKKTQEYIEQ